MGVQRHNVPHFKGLIVLYLDSRSSRAWQHFYLPPCPLEKGHFTPKNGYCAVWFEYSCIKLFDVQFKANFCLPFWQLSPNNPALHVQTPATSSRHLSKHGYSEKRWRKIEFWFLWSPSLLMHLKIAKKFLQKLFLSAEAYSFRAPSNSAGRELRD